MTESAELSQLKRALVALKEMRGRLDAVEKARTEPIAIIGIGCRFPGGANSPEAFWQLLQDGIDTVGEVPASRWDAEAFFAAEGDAPGKINTRYGAFLAEVDQFDPAFFGITPREARQMDPQQRLLLETAVEALERAGLPLDELTGSATGVFVGAHSHSSDYSWMQYQSFFGIDAYTSTGTAHSILANRLSYLFDWKGPSLSVDTACSSSLVALHLAVNSLRSGECEVALAGGVNLLLSPENFLTMSKLQALAPDGRCKTFDARADGFGRGEGCGVVVLKRLSDAQAAGDPIVAVIRGTAVNQDGSTNGLTAPNGLLQQAVIRQALASGKVEPGTISYIEAHGTGTVLGDPIEVEALAEVLGRAGDVTCYLGSVKTNIGHLEGAAGIAGLIKTALALQHRQIPPHLHFQALNPHISFAGTRFAVATTGQPWLSPGSDQPRRAGISSFGFGGTNAHVIVEEAPAPPPGEPVDAPSRFLLPLSARSEPALRETAQRLADFLQNTELPLVDVGYTAVQRRTHHSWRLLAEGQSREALAAQLRHFAQAGSDSAVVARTADEQYAAVVFVFSGQGTELQGVGRDLLAQEPLFREVIEQCDGLLRQYVTWSLMDVLTSDAHAAQLAQNEVAQPVIFAIQVALAALWQSWGIRPEAVIGHSLGEVAAACVAGALSLADAVRVVVHRGRVLGEAAGLGTMAAVGLSRPEVEALLANEPKVSLAVVNSPDSLVLSGDSQALQRIVATVKSQGKFARVLAAVNYPSHSVLMEPFSRRLEIALAGLSAQALLLPVFSTSKGGWATPGDFDAAFWGRNVRQPVLFADGIAQLAADGFRTFVEISHHPMLHVPIQQAAGEQALVVASLRRDEAETAALHTSLAQLYTHGVAVDWAHFYPQGQVVALPTYPWQRQRYWLEQPQRRQFSGKAMAHPLLGTRLPAPLPTFAVELGAAHFSFLNDHRVGERAIVPTTAFVEMALAAANETWGTGAYEIVDLTVQEALVVGPNDVRPLQIVLTEAAGERRFQCFSQYDDDWTQHANGRIRSAVALGEAVLDESVRSRCSETAVTTHYQTLADKNLHFGPLFQGITRLWQGDHEALAQIKLPLDKADDFRARLLLLDACLQPLLTTVSSADVYLLIGLERLAVAALPAELWSHARLRPSDTLQAETVTGDVSFYDGSGRLVGLAEGVLLKRVSATALRRLAGHTAVLDDWLYDVVWEPKPLPCDVRQAPDEFVWGENGRSPLPTPGHDATTFLQLHPHLEALSLAYTRQALAELGWPFSPGSAFTLDEAAAALRVVPRYRRLLRQLLTTLAQAGDLQAQDDGWLVIKVPTAVAALTAMVQQIRQEFPDALHELDLVAQCGSQLTAVLTGAVDPLTLLFPDGSSEKLAAFYQASAFARLPNALAAEWVQQLAQSAARPLRILEIGGGTGGTTTAVLPQLPTRCQYVFTDVSPLLVAQAKQKLSAFPFVRFAVLDVEENPAAQGFAEKFDLVIAANVLHATTDVRRTLAHVQQLLAPHGSLLAVEVTQPQSWINITFGLMDGWWHFTDSELRPNQPLLDGQQWRSLLAETGWQATAVIDPFPQLPALFTAQKPAKDTAGEWLIFADEGGVGVDLAARLRAEQKTAVLIFAGEAYAGAADRVTLNPMQPDHFAQLLAGRQQPLRHAVYLWGLDAAEDGHDAARVTAGALHLAQALQNHPGSQLWLVTRCAQAIDGAAPNAGQAVLWGYGRVLALEQPQVWGGLIDVDGENAAAHVLAEIAHPDGEDQTVWRRNQRLVARLQRAQPVMAESVQWRDGTYLLTGGLGGLGLKLAHWLAERGVRHLVLTSRTGLPDRSLWDSAAPGSEMARRVAAVRQIEALGAVVTAVSLDVADETAMHTLFQRFGSELPPLRAVFHMAAAIDFIPLAQMTAEDVQHTFHAKVAGSWLLHQLTQPLDLDHFVLFSSTTALWGVSEMAHYAAANTFLDALAYVRQAQGLPALSVNWGTWAEMRVTSEAEQAAIAGFGLRPMPVDDALELLARLLVTNTAQKVVADVDWTRLKPAYEARRQRPFLAQISAPVTAVAAQSVPKLREALEQAAPHERYDVLLDYVCGEVTAVMGYGHQQTLNIQQGLFDLGLDSLMAVELRSRLEKATAHSLPATLVFNYPSVAALVDFLANDVLELHQSEDGAEAVVANEPALTELDDTLPDDLLALFDDELGQIDDLLSS